MTRVRLGLGYDVVIARTYAGLAGELAALPNVNRLFIVSNLTVRALHGDALSAELGSQFAQEWFLIPDGEAHKSLATWTQLMSEMLARRADRNTLVLAHGGGVIGDLAGFAAASLLRGVRLVQLPTTLLAMVDASVGGKTGVNVSEGKNLVGAFHQPVLVWASMATLQTLPQPELRCGLGEVVKHAVIDGDLAVLSCERLAPAVVARDPASLSAVVEHSVRLKARIVEADPQERGVRALLNLGHTLAHGVEACAGYGELRHGEAVAIGLVAIAKYAVDRQHADAALLDRVTTLVTTLGLPSRIPAGLTADQLVVAMQFDKKRGRGMVKLVVPYSFGDVRVCEVSESELARLAQLAHEGASP